MESETIPTNTSFAEYQRVKLNTIVHLERLRHISEKVGLESASIELIDNTLERNKEQRFSIAVVGEFKRGKSTFINALLGKEILPSDILPCSATINRVTYGLKPGVKIIYRGEDDKPGREEEIGIDELESYVTKLTPESEKTAASIQEARVTYPLAYCKNNVDIIDTPGLNDDIAMTEVTLSVLPEVSAAILVIMPEAPFAGSEADFLNDHLLLQDLGRVIFVVTAIDRMRKKADQKRILDVIKNRIDTSVERRLVEQFGSKETEEYQHYRRQIGGAKVFGLSGYLALEAKEEGDEELLIESKLPEFEKELEKFITETRGTIELQVLSNRIISSSNEILKKLKIEAGALEMNQKEFDEAYQTSMLELDTLRQRRDQEVKGLEAAEEEAKKQVQPVLAALPEEIKQAVTEVVNSIDMTVDDIKSESFHKKLNEQVIMAVQNTAKRNSERLQLMVERHLMEAIERLGDFASEVSQTLYNIEMQFVEANNSEQANELAKGAVATVVGAVAGTIFGGALAGYHEAGIKGAGVGGAVGLGAAVAGAVVFTALSLPITWPAFIAMGLVSAFTGKKVARYLFKGQRIAQFKEQYTAHILEQIEEQNQKQRPDVVVNEHIHKTFKAVRDKLIGELDISIEQTRHTLDKLRDQQTRDEVRREHKREENEVMRQEVLDIHSKAQALSSYLIEITNI